MKKFCLGSLFILFSLALTAQSIKAKLDPAIQKFIADPQMKHAIAGIYIIDAKTGKPVAEKKCPNGISPRQHTKNPDQCSCL